MGLGMLVIMIVTLAGIANRFAEIGVKRAVGASRRTIFGEFLLESTVISLAGGCLGVLIGIGGTQGLATFQHLPFLINPLAIAAATAGSAVIGIVAGVVPANKAAKVDPIDALRI
jgi:putative ABC transport system permease protein